MEQLPEIDSSYTLCAGLNGYVLPDLKKPPPADTGESLCGNSSSISFIRERCRPLHFCPYNGGKSRENQVYDQAP